MLFFQSPKGWYPQLIEGIHSFDFVIVYQKVSSDQSQVPKVFLLSF